MRIRQVFRTGVVVLALLVTSSTIPVNAQMPSQQQGVPQPSVPSPGKELTLEEAIAIALQRQPQILAKFGAVIAAQARVEQALAPLLPSSSISWTATRSESLSSTTRLPSLSTSGTLQISLSQKLFDFGKNFAIIDSKKADTEASKADLELTKDTIILSVKTFYFNLLYAKRQVIVFQEALDRAELNLRSAKGFFEVGTRPKSDVTRAEVDVANARVALIQARNAVRTARVALNILLVLEVDAPTEVKDILTYEPFPVDPKQLAQEALKNRPEYTKVKAQEASAEATVREKFRQFFPDLDASGSYGGTGTESGTASSSVFPLGETWSLGLTFSWKWFDGLNNVAKYREAKANLESAQATTKSQELQIRQDVEQAYIGLVEAEERIGAAQKGVESAQENFRLAQGRFDAGVGTIIELTDAQFALTQAQSTEALALHDFRNNIATLERALGRR